MINGDTGLVGLLGNPVRHSLSPAMHNAALQALQLNWSYLALPCASKNLKEVLQGLRAVNCRGLNVTIPHKQDVAELCQELSPLAKRLGAVNTLIPLDSGGWHGTNTDVEGFLTPLGEQSSWQNCHGVIIGCGGSARAIAAGLQSLRLASITVIGRRQEALDAFIADLQSNDAPLTACLQSSPNLASLMKRADLVVNTTPVGMAQHGDAQAFPLGEAVWSQLQGSAMLYDLVYTPRPTAWLRWGQSRGHRCIDGLEMLVQQGAASLRLWSDRNDVPVETMRRAAEAALNP
ncbi:MAG: shikimate dehydrogenase [Parasynechococcus sp.]|jgi:shikimate dehydrogenase|uniref:shikimate dehydrogenase n=1 Tax=Parasynechococcus sp. TaxID=3101203 RepID=UPI000E1AB028|nr:MAG: shikimate dehydrogenase [Synechococcus sp. MED-G69]|tara:strand:+ start:707 stop:1576 length:870 start_codon:yes stop_codon:yes gene_type:complete